MFQGLELRHTHKSSDALTYMYSKLSRASTQSSPVMSVGAHVRVEVVDFSIVSSSLFMYTYNLNKTYILDHTPYSLSMLLVRANTVVYI
jgi:hypothetical protein